MIVRPYFTSHSDQCDSSMACYGWKLSLKVLASRATNLLMSLALMKSQLPSPESVLAHFLSQEEKFVLISSQSSTNINKTSIKNVFINFNKSNTIQKQVLFSMTYIKKNVPVLSVMSRHFEANLAVNFVIVTVKMQPRIVFSPDWKELSFS